MTIVTACAPAPVIDDAGRSSITDVRTTRDGVFTAAQADRGKRVYDSFCASCHPAEFYETRLLAWQDATVGELLEALSATMPSESPGALATSQYVDVIAYVLSITGSRAGDRELTAANAASVRIVGR